MSIFGNQIEANISKLSAGMMPPEIAILDDITLTTREVDVKIIDLESQLRVQAFRHMRFSLQ